MTCIKNSRLTDFKELKDSVIYHTRSIRSKPKSFDVKEHKDQMLHMYFDLE